MKSAIIADIHANYAELHRIPAYQVMASGHTHIPFRREIGKARLVNPGSLAGARGTSPQASHGIREDGHFQLKCYSYPFVQEQLAN
jgi:predicted phosphodiesterase